MPAITAAVSSGDLSIGNILTHLVVGGAGGAALTALIGSIKNKVA